MVLTGLLRRGLFRQRLISPCPEGSSRTDDEEPSPSRAVVVGRRLPVMTWAAWLRGVSRHVMRSALAGRREHPQQKRGASTSVSPACVVACEVGSSPTQLCPVSHLPLSSHRCRSGVGCPSTAVSKGRAGIVAEADGRAVVARAGSCPVARVVWSGITCVSRKEKQGAPRRERSVLRRFRRAFRAGSRRCRRRLWCVGGQQIVGRRCWVP